MKVRNGFVSNSSSSSFVFALPKEPESIEELINMMFKGSSDSLYGYDFDITQKQIVDRIYNDIQNEGKANEDQIFDEFRRTNNYWYWNLDDLRRCHIKDICIKNKLVELEIEKEKLNTLLSNIRSSMVDDILEVKGSNYSINIEDHEKHKDYKKFKTITAIKDDITNEIYKNRRNLAEQDAKIFIEENKDKVIYILEYEDHNSLEAAIEHGNVFDNVNHQRFSHH